MDKKEYYENNKEQILENGKKLLLAEALKEMNLGVDFIQDKRVQEGCSKRRPDFLFELFTHTVIVECDENDHKDYNTTCEINMKVKVVLIKIVS